MRFGLAVLWLLLAVPVQAQMHVVVDAERITFGAIEWMPRWSALLPGLVVPAGQTVTLPANSSHDSIEVAGTLECSRDYDTVVQFVHFVILPGGRFECGTDEDPMSRRVELIVRDVALDLERDPFQWGNGLINLGHRSMVGLAKAPLLQAEGTIAAGATTVTLHADPVGWAEGDEIVVPDTRQATTTLRPRRSAPMYIKAISGRVVTLAQPVDFAREPITDPQGVVAVRPRVANFTRNIVIKSENPAGTRGHTVNLGHSASWDVQYVRLEGLGRTTAENLHNTALDMDGNVVQLGTNQIGKYSDHDHHASTSLAVRQTVGNAYIAGVNPSKWGKVVHTTFDVLVADNVCADFVAGCFVTEDGPERRNIIRGNFGAYAKGNGRGARDNNVDGPVAVAPGGEGSCFWLRGAANTVTDNEAWNCAGAGFNLFFQDFVGAANKAPSAHGGPHDTVFDLETAVPIAFARNLTAGNDGPGFEYWSVSKFPAEHLTSAHSTTGIRIVNSANNHGHFVNPTLVNRGGAGSAISTSAAYISTLEVNGGVLAGFSVGIERGGAIRSFVLADVTLQNRTNIQYSSFPDESRFTRVLHRPLAAFPKRYIEFGSGYVWQVGTPTPGDAAAAWVSNLEAKHCIVDWQATGQDYCLMGNQQLSNTAGWPATTSGTRRHYGPEAGLTMGQLWDKYGLAFRGAVVDPSEAVTLEGVTNGVGRPGLARPLPVPRAVMTFPNVIQPAVPSNGRIRLYATLTGDPTQANGVAVFQVDGGTPVRRSTQLGGNELTRYYDTTAVSVGTHTVVTWREDLSGVKIPASELTFTYAVQ